MLASHSQQSFPAMNGSMVAAQDQGASGLTLGSLWRRLMRQKWLFLLTALTIFLIACLITFSISPTYRASTTIQIMKEGTQVVEFGRLSRQSPSFSAQDPFFRTQYEQLKSRALAQRVISDLDLVNRVYEQPEKKTAVAQWLSAAKENLVVWFPFLKIESKKEASNEDYIDTFLKGLYIEPIENTHLVKVYYESQNPELASEIVNTLVDTFIRESMSVQSETDEYANQFLEEELEKARESLNTAEQSWIDYAQEHNILEVNKSESSQARKLDELHSALTAAQRDRIQADNLARQGRLRGRTTPNLDNGVTQSLKRQLANLEAEYQNKAKIFKPNFPEMQQLSGQIETLRARLGQELASARNIFNSENSQNQKALEASARSARKLESDLRAELSNYKKELITLRDHGVEYDNLKREVDNSRQLYDALLQRKREINIASGVVSSNIRIIDEAPVPTKVFRPNRLLNLVLGGLVGLLVGLGLALFRDAIKQNVSSTTELQSISALPIIGSVPRADHMSESALALAVAKDQGTPIAEAYRIAAANLRFALPSGLPRVTVMTSVNPAEGKSTSSINMALSFAQMGIKVLLIDADLRRPTVHLKMGLSNSAGLSNYLTNRAELAQVTQPVDGNKGLFVISAGLAVREPVKLLSNDRMRQLLALSRKHFDAVIIDAPPITGFADALLLASMADTSVVVTNEGGINRKRMLAALEQLDRASPNVAGFLMVKAEEGVTDKRYYNRYRRARKDRNYIDDMPTQTQYRGRGSLNLARSH